MRFPRGLVSGLQLCQPNEPMKIVRALPLLVDSATAPLPKMSQLSISNATRNVHRRHPAMSLSVRLFRSLVKLARMTLSHIEDPIAGPLRAGNLLPI
jgi:hypothetical protein